jgi:NitT/TauT family transport system ATP-binding protein
VDLAPAVERTAARILISVRDVCLSLAGRPILHNINLEIRQREFVCVIGPSGCGKTTLLRMIAGLQHPERGKITYCGKSVTGPARDVALIFQDYGKALLPWRTVAGNVSLAFEAMGIPRGARAERVRALLEKVGLAQHADKYPPQLSGGMQQRVQIARCLAQNPAVLLMDEPFGSLDAMTKQVLQDEILQIAQVAGTSVVFVTHDLEEAIYLGDRVVAFHSNPSRVPAVFDVQASRPRNQLTTRESPEFMSLRRVLFDFMQADEK